MSSDKNFDLPRYCTDVAQRAAIAARAMATVCGETKNRFLLAAADALGADQKRILRANQTDLDAAPEYGMSASQIDRLRLSPARLQDMSQALREIALLPDPVGQTIGATIRPNGLEVAKVRVPLGVVFFIYESRPNVTVDAAAICMKSGNAVILRGGKEASHSSAALVACLREAAEPLGLPPDAVQLVSTTDREAVTHFLKLREFIDVAIPRGGASLIRRVTSEATMPVIKHFDGNCHVYLDESADAEMAEAVVVNAKCQRMGVCNACESLLVHESRAADLLPRVATALRAHHIELRGDQHACRLVPEAVAATDEDYFTEFLGPCISIRVVESLEQAIQHINHYGSHHTDAIITENLAAARQFVREVDSAAVLVNASTRFHDGSEFGLGAEIGISTDKFHARGPCGLEELTSYKYVVYGNGQIKT
jgi:glutamate-5-semialdehyde dehydrogenase